MCAPWRDAAPRYVWILTSTQPPCLQEDISPAQPIFLLCPLDSIPLSSPPKDAARGARELKYCAAAQPQPLDRSPKSRSGEKPRTRAPQRTLCGVCKEKINKNKSRLTQLQIPVASRHRQTSSEQGVSLFISERQIRDTLTPPFLSSFSSSSTTSSSSSSFGWHPSCYCRGDAVGSPSAQPDNINNNNTERAMFLFSPPERQGRTTHLALPTAPPHPSVGDLLGAGASSEAGCSLVSVCERETGMWRGVGEENERERGEKDTPPPALRR